MDLDKENGSRILVLISDPLDLDPLILDQMRH